MHVWSPSCHEDEFFRRLCESWSNHDHPEEVLTRAPSLSSVYQDWLSVSSFLTRKDSKGIQVCTVFHLEPLLVLVISRPQKLTVSPSWRNTTTSVKCKLVFVCSKSLKILVPQISLCMIRPVSVLISSVLRELVAIAVCRPPPPHKICPCSEVHSLSQCAMLSDHLSVLRSQFCCGLLQLLMLCSPLLVSDVFGYCLLAQRLTTDVQVSVSVDQEFALLCLQLHRRMRNFAVNLRELPPGADVLLTARYQQASSRTFLTSDFVLVGAVGNSMNLGNVPASKSSSYAGLCKRGRPGRFRCGDHGVKSITFNAAGTHLAGSWRRRTAPAAVPIRCSSLGVSRPRCLSPMAAEAD